MSADARAENEACAAVVDEFRALMAQEGIAPPLLKLCDELAGRIRLRALLAPRPENNPQSTRTP